MFIVRILVFGLRISDVVDLLHAPIDESAVKFQFVVANEIVAPGFDGAVVGLFEDPIRAHAAAAAGAGEGADERHGGICLMFARGKGRGRERCGAGVCGCGRWCEGEAGEVSGRLCFRGERWSVCNHARLRLIM